MKLYQLNLFLDSGIPIVSVNAPLPERINVLEEIYIECAQMRNIPLYVWNAGWGCFKQTKYDSDSQLNFANPQYKHNNIFINLDYLLNGQGKRISNPIDIKVLRHHYDDISKQQESSTYNYYP